MSYPESLESSLVCPDRYCPKVFDPQRNMVLCRCYQTQVTSPSNSHLLPATIPCTESPPSYTGSMPYGECQTVPQSGLNYPSYLGYTSGFDGYGVYQSIYPHLSPNMTSTDWSMYGAQQTSPFSQPSQMDQILRSQVNDFWNYQQLSAQVNGSDIPATKQSTKLLKTWLREHKKNPYPTKTEKVMLAYAGRMTMTQISNWFANARRRMKQQKDQGSISDSALSDVSEDDDSICKSPTSVGDLYTNAHAALKDPNFPGQHTRLTSLLKERDNLMKIHKPQRMTELKVESSPTETAVVKPESCNDTLITDTTIKSVRTAEQKTAVVKPESYNDTLITDTTIKSVRTAEQKTAVVKPESYNDTLIKVESSPTETAVVKTESCTDKLITDTTIKSVRTAEQKTGVVKPESCNDTLIKVESAPTEIAVNKTELCNDTLITDTTIKHARTTKQKTESTVVKPEISRNTVIAKINVNLSTTKSKIWSVSSILS